MNLRVAIILACGAGLLVVLGTRLAAVDFGTALPEWVPEFPEQPLTAVGERRLVAHWTYAMALTPEHRLLAWGGDGDEGFPGARGRAVEVPVALDEAVANWRSVSGGIAASYAVTQDGALLRRAMRAGPDPSHAAPRYTPLFPDRKWLKAEQVLHLGAALAQDGTLHLWHEQTLQEGRVCPRRLADCLSVTPDGMLSGQPDLHLERDIAAQNAAMENSLAARLEQARAHWRGQPGGDTSPAARTALERLAAELEQVRQAESAARERRRVEYVRLRDQALAWPVPHSGRWTDFCLAGDGGNRRYRVHALDGDGKLWRIEVDADDFRAQLEPKAALVPLRTPAPFQRVYCAGATQGAVMLLDGDRRLWGFGDNGNGQLSPELKAEEREQRVFPHEIKDTAVRKLSRRRWRMVAPGHAFSAGIASNGDLWAWGDGYGRLMQRRVAAAPELVDDRRDWREVAIAGDYLVARDAAGTVYTWGSGTNAANPYIRGLLGDGGVAEHRDQPRPIVIAP